MDEKELLRKAFESGEVPGIITYCFTELCPMKNNCIHYLASLYKNDDIKRGHAIFPNALKTRPCHIQDAAPKITGRYVWDCFTLLHS